MDVELIQWPAQRERRNRLADRNQPRLLLVAADAEPPSSTDLLEEWVRLPVSDKDVRARVRDLHGRVAAHQPLTPTLDGDGVLHNAGSRAALSPLHAALTRVLLSNIDRVTSRADLEAAGWPTEAPERNTVDVHMARLRRRLAEVGLTIKTVRSRGYLLERGE